MFDKLFAMGFADKPPSAHARCRYFLTRGLQLAASRQPLSSVALAATTSPRPSRQRRHKIESHVSFEAMRMTHFAALLLRQAAARFSGFSSVVCFKVYLLSRRHTSCRRHASVEHTRLSFATLILYHGKKPTIPPFDALIRFELILIFKSILFCEVFADGIVYSFST